MEYTLAMTFLTASGEKSTLSVSGVKPTLTKNDKIYSNIINLFAFHNFYSPFMISCVQCITIQFSLHI